MMELLWTPEAVRDREDIYDYIEQIGRASYASTRSVMR